MRDATGTKAARAADGRPVRDPGPNQARRGRRPAGIGDPRRGLAPFGRHEIEAMLRALDDGDDDAASETRPSVEIVDEAFDEMAGALHGSLGGLSAYLRHAGLGVASLADRDDDW